MLTAAAIAIVLLGPALGLVGLLRLVEARHRARAEVIARQVMLTDAIHAELGAIVSPVVDKPPFRPWRVTFALLPSRAAEVGRLVSITDHVLGRERVAPSDVQIVFTRAASSPRTRAA